MTPDENIQFPEDIATAAADSEVRPGADPAVKATLQELIKVGYLEEARKPALFRNAIVHEAALSQALEPLDLALRVDSHRGLALLVLPSTPTGGANEDPNAVADSEWKHPLVRRQRLTLEQSLLTALLREAFLLHEQERGVGQAAARIPVEDLLPKFFTYVPPSGSDNRDETRLASLLDQLKSHGIVSEIDKNNEIIIRPLIVHLTNADSLSALLQTFQSHAESE